jgi:hypothetical protein
MKKLFAIIALALSLQAVAALAEPPSPGCAGDCPNVAVR